jgi:hypothetical protein
MYNCSVSKNLIASAYPLYPVRDNYKRGARVPPRHVARAADGRSNSHSWHAPRASRGALVTSWKRESVPFHLIFLGKTNSATSQASRILQDCWQQFAKFLRSPFTFAMHVLDSKVSADSFTIEENSDYITWFVPSHSDVDWILEPF